MQSSPPTRAWERPSSPVDSEYSLDLGALGMDARSDVSATIPKQHVERIFSEDIDGPSDFTQNMEMWMRGGTISKRGTLKSNHAGTEAMDRHKGVDNDLLPNAPLKSLRELPGERISEQNEDYPGSYEPLYEEPMHDEVQDEGQFSSEWDPYGAASTPMVPVNKRTLQTTVEEYYSELSPARYSQVQMAGNRSLLNDSPQSPITNEKSPSSHVSSTAGFPVGVPALERIMPVEHSHQNEDNGDLDIQLKQLHVKCREIEQLNDTLRHALNEERSSRQKEAAAHKLQMADATEIKRMLTEQKNTAVGRSDHMARQVAEIEGKLQAHERKGQGNLQCDHPAQIGALRDQMEQQESESARTIKTLQHDLDHARSSRDDAEESARVYREEIEELREEHEAKMDRSLANVKHTREDNANIEALQQRLVEATTEIERLKLNGSGANASEFANFQSQLKEIVEELRNSKATHTAEISDLQSSHNQALDSFRQDISVLRSELDTKQTELNEAILERDSAQDSLSEAHSELESLKTELGDLKTVNAEFDARISDKLRQREKLWRGKFETETRERGIMAKALMHQWGREEVGVDKPQAYAYKYPSSRTLGEFESRSKA